MELALILVCLGSLLVGAFITLSVAIFGKRFGDKGAASLIFPLTTLFLLSLAEFFRLLGLRFGWPQDVCLGIRYAEEALRILLSFAWVWTNHRHLILNGYESRRQRLTPWFAAGAALSLAFLSAGRLGGLDMPVQAVTDLQVAAFLIYAAVSGLVSMWARTVRLPSTRAILALAGISLIIYPMVSAADLLGLPHFGFDPTVPFWMETQPLYYLIACVPMYCYVRGKLIAIGFVPADQGCQLAGFDLTEREREILTQLARGKSYKDIAYELGISLATVKTHVNRAYAKLGIKSRAQLQALVTNR